MISLEEPDIKKLLKVGYNCADMHFHTRHSDGAATVDEVLKKIRELGIGVAITDHNEISGCLEAYEKKEKGDFIIPGIEVKSREMVDILFYFDNVPLLREFYDKEIYPNKKRFLHTSKTRLTLGELYSLSRKYACVASVAHPFGYSLRASLKDIFARHKEVMLKFDTIEAINGGNARSHNSKAISLINENGKGFTGGTDGHSIFPLGRVLTCSKSKTVTGFLQSIKSKKNIVIGTETRMSKLGDYVYYGVNRIKTMFG